MEKWNDICYKVNLKSNINEKSFQEVIIDNVFEKLGWSQYKNEIDVQRKIKSGRSDVIPDLIIKDLNDDLFVIELKKPSHIVNEADLKQLFSYMRLLKLNFGLLISKKIQLFYDVPDDKEYPIMVLETEFKPNNEIGLTFTKLFEKKNFDIQKLTNFCEDKVEEIIDIENANNLIEYFTDNKSYIEKFKKLIKKDIEEDYNDNIIKLVLDNIIINIKHNNKKPDSNAEFSHKTIDNMDKKEKLPITLIPENINDFKKQFIEKGKAYLNFHYEDGRIETKVWKNIRFTEKANLMGNLRSRKIARKGLWKEKGIKELIVTIDKK